MAGDQIALYKFFRAMAPGPLGPDAYANNYDYDYSTSKGTACIPDQHVIIVEKFTQK